MKFNKILFLSTLCLGVSLSAMDTLEKEQTKKYQLVYRDQTEEITEQEFNALNNQSITIKHLFEDIDEDIADGEGTINIPVGIEIEKVKQVLPFLVLIEQKQIDELKAQLEDMPLQGLIDILKTANYLDCQILLDVAIQSDTWENIDLQQINEKVQNQLPGELLQLIATRVIFKKPEVRHIFESLRTLSQPKVIGSGTPKLALNSTDGSIAIGWGSSITILNTQGKIEKTLQGDSASVRSMVFSKDGTLLAVGYMGPTTYIFDVSQGTCIKQITVNHWQDSLCFSPDNKKIAIAANQVGVYEIKTGKPECSFDCHYVIDLVFSSDGNLLITADNHGSSHIYDLVKKESIHKFGKGSGIVSFPDQRHYLIRDIIFDLKEKKNVYQFDWFPSCATFYKNKLIVGSWSSGTIEIFDLDRFKICKSQTKLMNYLKEIHVKGDLLIAGGSKLQLWDLEHEQLLFNYDISSGDEDLNQILSLAMNENYMITTSSNDHVVRLWPLKEFFEVYNFCKKRISLDQALFLLAWCNAQENKQEFDYCSKHMQAIFKSLPKQIQQIVNPQNKTNYWQGVVEGAVGAAAVVTISYWLYKKYFSKN